MHLCAYTPQLISSFTSSPVMICSIYWLLMTQSWLMAHVVGEMTRKSSCSSRSYMEKVVLSSSYKGSSQKLKDGLHSGGVASVGTVRDDADDLLSTGPPRSYTCSFCKRRFKSAQALGGHMNVHRRARALLRSQSISPIPSPPSSISPSHPMNIITTPRSLENDVLHLILPGPSPSNTPHHIRNPSYPYLLSHLPMINITSSTTLRHKNPLPAAATPYKHVPGGQYLHANQPFNGVSTAKKNCIRVEDKLNGISIKNTHHDDALVRLSLGNGLITSNSVDQQEIDLELHL